MGDICGISSPSPRITPRNGLDYQPKKTNPNDFSNVSNDRDWQMSPFPNERYDLDEIQKAEKLGFKGKLQLENLKNKFEALKSGKPLVEKPKCPVCAEREAAELRRQRIKCSTEYLYQPYGPNIYTSLSYSKPELKKPRMYTYLGPSRASGFRFKVPAPEMVSPIPCQDVELSLKSDFKNVYIPYGPLGELRITPDLYVPMGPSVFPLLDN